MTNRWLTGGKEVTLVGPPGVAALHQFLITFFKDDLSYRMLREIERGMSGLGMFEGVMIKEIAGSRLFRLGELMVTTAKLTHTMYDLGYRFEAGGKTVVVSGDTSYDEHLVELAAGADVLVMDADERPGDEPWHRRPRADLLESRYVPTGEFGGDFSVRPHATLDEVAAMAAAAGVRHLVMTHLRGAPVDEPAAVAVLRKGGFEGRVTVAHDGLEVAV